MTLRRRVQALLVAALLTALVTVGFALRVDPADGADAVRITAVGDYGTTSNTSAVLTALAGRTPDAHIALGDMSYDNLPETEWCSFVKAHVGEKFPFELLAGNHEMNGRNGNINNFSSCLPNQIPGVVGTYGREYYFDLPSNAPLVRMINVSPGLAFPEGQWNYDVGDPHYTWLADAIDSARAAEIPFVVVSTHYPCVTNGVYGCTLPLPVRNLLLDKKVDLVLHGHEHSYNRTHQLWQGVGDCPALTPAKFNAACIADSDNNYTAGAGTVFATVGTGGIPLRDINPASSSTGYLASMAGLNVNPTYGFLEFTVTKDELKASFVRAAGGSLSDSFRIGRGSGPYLTVGSTWRLNDTGADLGTAWSAAGYDDSAWKTGAAQWGYGDGDEATKLARGTDPNTKPLTVYGRTTFNADSIDGVTALDLRALVDDGVVIYLNGTEVWRNNMPTGTVTASTSALRAVMGTEESRWISARIPAGALRPGTNTVAVEVHQDQPSSSDISFDLELMPVR